MKFFHRIYVAIFKWYAFLMLRLATSAVRKLMLMLGKNPDYIPPALPPLPVSASLDDAWIVSTRYYKPAWTVDFTNSNYVKNPKDHPIVKQRIELAEKAEKAKKEAEEAAKTPTLQVTGVGGETIDAIQTAVCEIEKTVELEKKPE